MTLAFAVAVLAGFAAQNSRTKFGEIDVERINIVEPDGSLRMVISNMSGKFQVLLFGN
ncbi:MAG: hypothetical protein WA755_16540 [Candidatus Acidiferrales bacterium]